MQSAYTVPEGTRRARADKVLAAGFPEHSRTAIQRAFEASLVRRKGTVIGQKSSVSEGDILEFSLPDTTVSELVPNAILLDILFEDEHLLAINKEPGMVVHPGAGTGGDTLVHALLAHCAGSLSGIGGVERPGIVHRLDRETSGVILAAKSDAAHRGLAAQFASRTVHKEYLALVSGLPELLSGSIRKPIGRNTRQRHKMTVIENGPGGRDARTDWSVVEKFGKRAALVRCVIHSGRTHQIRVHLKSLGTGILGDAVYGYRHDPTISRKPERVMLHAEHLVLKHPITGKVLDIRAPIPKDFTLMMKALRKGGQPVKKVAPS